MKLSDPAGEGVSADGVGLGEPAVAVGAAGDPTAFVERLDARTAVFLPAARVPMDSVRCGAEAISKTREHEKLLVTRWSVFPAVIRP
jgi:hypothetical protein